MLNYCLLNMNNVSISNILFSQKYKFKLEKEIQKELEEKQILFQKNLIKQMLILNVNYFLKFYVILQNNYFISFIQQFTLNFKSKVFLNDLINQNKIIIINIRILNQISQKINILYQNINIYIQKKSINIQLNIYIQYIQYIQFIQYYKQQIYIYIQYFLYFQYIQYIQFPYFYMFNLSKQINLYQLGNACILFYQIKHLYFSAQTIIYFTYKYKFLSILSKQFKYFIIQNNKKINQYFFKKNSIIVQYFIQNLLFFK
ncbi:hypothetical protein IMG5_045370 [Ichthyophthirius multifiliis]|uniref:Transmembrane protein n=1 Tax=Ichthyophthirius multifiliis TaxID=5932 RepID=G0QM65_ICHMU|nr:hypothetical protein IMG5_045370 [Ichthyophthirius multifiliis]EGR33690.1 hypothetical protein IMG5_045370 [Ichthyophthirius multifiliis]|eukprot:XP_004037676.1 hypothetical protein IMG5_045370 [Ichthyophthirius multifiliis]